MRRMILLLSLAGAMAAMMSISAVAALAQDNLIKPECEALGGTFANETGTKTCTLPTTNPGGQQPGFEVVSGQQGMIGNQGTAETASEECQNPAGNEVGSTSNPNCQP